MRRKCGPHGFNLYVVVHKVFARREGARFGAAERGIRWLYNVTETRDERGDGRRDV